MSAGQVQCVNIQVDEAAGTDDEIYWSNPFPGTWKIDAIYFAPGTALAINATNYITVTVSSNDGAAGSDVTVATHNTNTGGTAHVLKTNFALTLTAGVGLELAQGEGLKFASVGTSSGGAWDGTYCVAMTKVRV